MVLFELVVLGLVSGDFIYFLKFRSLLDYVVAVYLVNIVICLFFIVGNSFSKVRRRGRIVFFFLVLESVKFSKV